MHLRSPLRAIPFIVLAASGLACRDSPGPPVSTAASAIRSVSPAGASAPVGTTLAEPLVARVEDEFGRAVRGAEVEFVAADDMATLEPTLATSDARGEVRTIVTLGQTAGRIDIVAKITGSDSSVRFTVTATALAATRVAVVPAPMRLERAGETGRLYGNLADQYGNAAGGGSISWVSLDPAVAVVDGSGLVTAVQEGATARIVAAAAGLADTVRVSVADAATPVCGADARTLAPGESLTMDPRTGTCLRAAAGAEYVAVAFFASEAPASESDPLRIVGTGLPPAPAAVRSRSDSAPAVVAARPAPDDGFERRLRAREDAEVAPLAPASRAALSTGDAGAASLLAVPADAKIGDLVTINGSPTHACAFPTEEARRQDTRIGRVVAITDHAVVVADTANPAGGFTSAEYRDLGMTFDTLVVPVDEGLFGAPGDLDANGRSVIFYTMRVNQIATSADSYVGGFFWSRDLLARSACATSNVAEIFYMLVPDPNGLVGARRSKAFVEEVTVGTLGHEYQHLINASRRFADPAAEPTEVAWLNEGLSHIAEEMLFYRTTGLQPRSNIGAELFGNAEFEARYFSFQHNNITRLERWLVAPNTNTPYGPPTALATRGAAWAFLRYLADRQPDDGDVWYRLVNSRTTGIANLEQAFGVDVLTATRQWAVAMYADDHAVNADPVYRFPSWNLRSLYPVLPRGPYPIRTTPLANNNGATFVLRGGGAAYFPFVAGPTGDAHVWVTTTTGSPQPPIRVTVLRVR